MLIKTKVLQFCVLTIIAVCAISCVKAQTKIEKNNFQLAADYSKNSRGLAVLIYEKDKLVFEEYQNGHSAETSHLLASGTKSFSGVLLAAAIEDGLIKNFDEKVSETITEWKNDKQKTNITFRQLLSLTSGIDAGNNGRVPSYQDAINYPFKYEAGTTFQYGPVPFQIFGEVLKRKLAPKKESVLDYLKRRILNPIGLKIADWRLQDGQPNLPSGASLTAKEWAKFGQFLLNNGKLNGKQIVKKNLLEELNKGSNANANYGLTFWLNRSDEGTAKLAQNKNGRSRRIREILNIQPETDEISQNGLGKNLPKDIFLAAGAGKQRLYIIPSKNLVIVRQGRQSRFDDGEFLSLLFFGKK